MKDLKVYQDSDDSKTVLLAEWEDQSKEAIERVCFLAKPHFSPASLNMNDLQQTITALLQVISK